MRSMSFLVLVALHICAVPAFADWEYTTWGMSPEEVIAASGGTANATTADEKEKWRTGVDGIEGVDALLKAPYSWGKFDFLAVFYFTRSSGKLKLLHLELLDLSLGAELEQAMRDKYGTPAMKYIPLQVLDWIDASNEVTLVHILEPFTVVYSEKLVESGSSVSSNKTPPDQTNETPDCAAIQNPEERLACYDALARKPSLDAGTSSPPIETSGKWIVRSEVSPVDDSTNVFLYLDAEDTIPGKYGGETRPTLILRCKENETDLFINWDYYLGGDTTKVLIRLDKGQARETSWNISTDNTATFHPKAIALIKDMVPHDLMLARTTPYGESPVTVTFDIRGLSASLGKLQEACHWN